MVPGATCKVKFKTVTFHFDSYLISCKGAGMTFITDNKSDT